MIRHIVLLKFKEGTDRRKVEEALEAVRDLQRKTAETIDWQIAEDIGDRESSYPYALIADFEDLVAVNRYQESPGHAKLLEEIGPLIDATAAIDFEV